MPPGAPGTRRNMTVEELLAEARSGLARVTPEELGAARAAGAVLVDIRGDAQRAADGPLPGAVVVARNVLEWRCDPRSPWREEAVSDPARVLVLVCNEGYQSSLAAATLQRLGLPLATDLVGGFQALRVVAPEVCV